MSSIASRSSWGARYRDGFGSRAVGRLTVWMHHTVTSHLPESATVAQERAQMRAIESIGQSRFNGGISYTFVVFPSGRIYQGHSIDRIGAHTQGHNTTGVGIALAGNYQTTKMTAAQERAIAWLLREGVAKGWWRTPALTGGHRDTKATACPGDAAYRRIKTINQLAQEDDMPTAKEIAAEVWSTEKKVGASAGEVLGTRTPSAILMLQQGTYARRDAREALARIKAVEAAINKGTPVSAKDIARELETLLADDVREAVADAVSDLPARDAEAVGKAVAHELAVRLIGD